MSFIADAVQPPDWASALPRPWYKSREKIQTPQPWFDVYSLPCGGYAIYEPGHFQEVISFLLIGRDAALLWDTGMGMGDMRALVEHLTELPVIVVNSHTHFDHMGGNWQFDRVYAIDHAIAKQRISTGLPREAVEAHTTPDQFARALPKGFDAKAYTIKGARYEPVSPGHVFDLGGRRLKVLHTPGHSPDSIMLYDDRNGILLTGDTLYPATLYAHLDAGGGMMSDFSLYRRTLNILSRSLYSLKTLYCSHNEPVVDSGMLRDAAQAFNTIAEGNASYETDERGLRLYRFEGFAIVADPKSLI